jgi:hypothetical protein
MMMLEYIVSFFGGDTTLITQWVKTGSESSFLLIGLSGFSLVTFVMSLVALPVIIAKIPWDYFLETTPRFLQSLPLLPRICLLVVKNMAGGLLIALGIIMLFIPGQGLLTIIVGVAFMNFPGKKKLERLLLKTKKIRRALNWVRNKRGAKEFKFP